MLGGFVFDEGYCLRKHFESFQHSRVCFSVSLDSHFDPPQCRMDLSFQLSFYILFGGCVFFLFELKFFVVKIRLKVLDHILTDHKVLVKDFFGGGFIF